MYSSHGFLAACAVMSVWVSTAEGVPRAGTKGALLSALASTTAGRSTTTAATPKTSGKLVLDYDYQDFGRPANTGKLPTKGDDAARPHAQVAVSGQQLPPVITSGTPPTAAGGARAETLEWLRDRVRQLQRHGLQDGVDALQKQHPSVNLTLLGTSHGYRDAEDNDGQYYHDNGTYHWHPGQGDVDDGFWYNDTFYSGHTDDGYFYNGTWYPGDQDMDDGFYFNGTYYPEIEEAENEGGHYNNATSDSEYEHEVGGEQEENEHEDLMWWQLHHPKWKDVGENHVEYNKPELSKSPDPNQQKYTGTEEGRAGQAHVPVSPRHQEPQLQPAHPPPHQSHAAPKTQRPPPGVLHRPPPQRPTAMRKPTLPKRPGHQPFLRKKSGGVASASGGGASAIGGGASASGGRASASGGGASASGGAPLHGQPNTETRINKAGTAALAGNEPSTQHLPGENSLSAAASWGIALAVILGACIILAPAVCLLYKYREQKRIKKRTFLRRPEHGSVDDGIMDAMVMKELGERKGSRVRPIDAKQGGRRKSEKRKDVGRRWEKLKIRQELQPASSSRSMTFVDIDGESHVITT